MLISSLSEVLTVNSVMPFLSFLSNSNASIDLPLYSYIARIFDISDGYNSLVFSSILFGTAALVSGSLRLTTIWLSGRLASAIGSDLSCSVYQHTLYQPYEFHLQKSSSEVVSVATLQIKNTIAAISSVFQIMTGIFVSFALLISLILINIQLAILSLVFFGSTYILIAAFTKKRIATNSSIIVKSSSNMIKIIQESLGGIRDIILTNTHTTFL